jgi:hypothetical protein
MVDAARIDRDTERLIVSDGAIEIADGDNHVIESESHVLHSGLLEDDN